MADEHRGARPRRGDDTLELVERGDRAPRRAPRRRSVAAVIGRLAAAGLRPGHDDAVAGPFDQPRGGEAYGGPEQIDQTGREEADRRAGFRFFRHTPAAFSAATGSST